MLNKKFIAIFAVLAVILSFGLGVKFSGYLVKTQSSVETEPSGIVGEQALVARVIDGDTIVLTDGERVRLIGVDSDEKGGECYEEAKQRMQELVEGKDVLLEKDITNRDKYGRLLRYIYVDDVFVNLVMVEEGLAQVYTFKPDVKYVKQFEDALRVARDGNGCLWK